MQYKSIVLEFLQQRPEIHEQLRKERKLLMTMERYAAELKARHLAWMEFLTRLRPDNSRTLLASEALEFALKEMRDRFSTSFRQPNSHQVLDTAMLFIRKHPLPRR